MTDSINVDSTEEIAAPDSTATRSERRALARQALTRRTLAATAGVGLVAGVLSLVALGGAKPTPAVKVHLPSAQAALAAYESGIQSASPAAVVAPGSKTVMIQNYAFSPATLTIAAGTKVTWTNMDTAPHTVTVKSGPVKFSSPSLNTGDTFTYTFTAAGTYSYYCAVHPDMMASVVVTGGATTTPTTTPTTTTTTPTSTPTTGMTMPTTSTSTDSCEISGATQSLLTHINHGHLEESPGQQVSDILNLDQYVGTHLGLVEQMLDPATSGGLTDALSGALTALFVHVNHGHLEESVGQQAQDILNVNQYVQTHTALVENMISGFEALAC